MADALYLQENVGAALTAGLASCASAQPDDPVDYLAHWLLKYLAVQDKKELAKEADAEVQKQRAVLERVEEEKVQADAARLHKLNEAKKAIEACTNIPKFYKAIVDGVRTNTKAKNVYIAELMPVTTEEEEHSDEEPEVWEEDTREPPPAGEDGVVPELPPWVPPKILPKIPKYSKLKYVFASEDNRWLRGKEIRSPACKMPDDPAVVGGGGGRTTVSFQAVHDRGGRVVRNVLESDPELHFFDMPMPGSFACQALLQAETDKYLAGGVMGLLCCDTVDADGTLEDKDGDIFKELSGVASVTYSRLQEEAKLRKVEEDEVARKLLEEDIVLPSGEAAEGEEAVSNPEACLAPEEGADEEKEIEALEAEIKALSDNLDLTNTGTGRLAVVKQVIKDKLPETKSNEHGREIPDMALDQVLARPPFGPCLHSRPLPPSPLTAPTVNPDLPPTPTPIPTP
jgi:hypothetical protein